MSSLKIWGSTKGTVTRTGSGGNQGDGKSKRFYVGISAAGNTYRSFWQPTVDWTGVGRIVSATLLLYSDDQNGLFPPPSSTDKPTIDVRRLTSIFTEGTNADNVFTSGDYTSPTNTSSAHKIVEMAKASGYLTRIDITTMVEEIAPSTVKRRDGTPGGKALNHGFALLPLAGSSPARMWSGWSEDATDSLVRPTIELVYDLGATVPSTPTSLTPAGSVASIGSFTGVFSDPRASDTLRYAEVEVYTSVVTNTGQTINLNGGNLVWASGKIKSSNSETVAGITNLLPSGLTIQPKVTYKWRLRQYDQEHQVSPWTSLVSFNVSNTDPTAPTLSPTGLSYYSLKGINFTGGTFSDPDSGDKLGAYQVQLSRLSSASDPNWDDADWLLWDTGKVYTASGATSWSTRYGGNELTIGSYYWRARQWDLRDGVSAWSYGSINMLADFDPAPGSQSDVQIDPKAPWRIVIKEMAMLPIASGLTGSFLTGLLTTSTPHGMAAGRRIRFTSLAGGTGLFNGVNYYVLSTGLTTTSFQIALTLGGTPLLFSTDVTAGTVTAVTTRGPGKTVAILENAKSVGASYMYNSPGELHFTLPTDHPQISVIEPKQTHYSLQFYSGDGWRETFAGLIWDFDATETGVIFFGFDYLALFDYTQDTRFDPNNIDKSDAMGGSKYVAQTISSIITSQLNIAINKPNSILGFLTVGSIPSMPEKVTIWSTMRPTLSFVTGLIDSHRQGSGNKTRIRVVRTTTGAYQVVIDDNPGVVRNNLRLSYGELVQGYRVVPFGKNWASVQNAIGRKREGIAVLYKTASAPGIDQSVWGSIAQTHVFDGVSDENDLIRRMKQAAIRGGKLGRDIAVGVRSGVLQPRNGYDLCDEIPVKIKHGAVDTDAYGSGYWVIFGIAWEAKDDGDTNTTLTILPREDTSSPDTNLIPSTPLSTQPEWQVGFIAPDPLSQVLVDGAIWIDSTDGHIHQWDAVNQVWVDLTLTLNGSPRVLGDNTVVSTDFGQPLPGGHNVILNSGFELGPFPTAVYTLKTYDVLADWSGQRVRAVTNVTEGAGALTMTGSTY